MVSKKPWNALALAMVLMANLLPLVAALPNLRIMPLGDSITKGSGSRGIVGYRGPLRRKLLSQGKDDGITVDMVGSLRDGDMPDNNHEGHSGKYLHQINTYWKLSIEARPNLVLIHAGTNNMDKNQDLDTALDIYRSIIDEIFAEAPEVTILVAPIIWANKPAMQVNTDHFNPQLEALIKLRQQQGKRILPVPIDIGPGDLWDEKHPNDRGYEKMADAWLKAILEADSLGLLKKPVPMTDKDAPDTGIGNSADGGSDIGGSHGKIWEKKGTVFEGFRTWESVGTIASAAENGSRDKLILADLNGDGIADYIIADNDGTVRAWINGGKPSDWKSLGKINPDWNSNSVKGSMIRMADVDNDGKADMIVLYSDGAAKVWKNTDNGKTFKALDSKWATGLASADKVHFEDIDGDGYADYVIVYSGGGVRWARNTRNNGEDSGKKNWEADKAIAPGPAGMPADRARLRDIDGDGKADYLVAYQGGAVKAWRNTIGDGGTSNNWADLGTIVPGVSGVTGDMIRFADMDGDGLPDFLAVADDGSIRMWKNLGIVGTKGASIRFADLTGDGKDDIISVDAKGRARAWTNKGVDKWESMGEIAPGFDEDLSSARIEFADINGDKKADYIVIYGGGSVKAYLNNGNLPNPGNNRIWQSGITISPGVGEPGSKIRFADLNGDGYDDFLVLYEGGAVKCWLNKKNMPPKDGERIWGEGETVATGVGEPGSKIRFADLTGDGKADYIVQYDGGAAKAYRNLGKIGTSKGGRKWSLIGTVATGVSPQGTVYYADINGDKKADYLVSFDGGAVNGYLNSYDWIPNEDEGDGKDDDNKDDDDTKAKQCESARKTYSTKIDRVGEYMDWEKMEWSRSAIVGVQYITIVNLTPHRFVYDADGSNSNQMTNWDFGGIPPGKARQNAVEYSSKAVIKIDSNGEAYYSLEGTSDKFVVRVTNHEHATFPKRIVFDLAGMGAGWREYNCPQVETPVTLVITGSADYEHGYITSLVHGDAGWMQGIKDVIKDRQLNQVVMPGTHDAGISRITGALISAGGQDNTQTQNLNIKDQLRAGSRWFDLRIASIHGPGKDNYDFWAVHVNDEVAHTPLGGSGEKLSEIIDEINEFTSEHPGEVIILQTRALMGLYRSPTSAIFWDDGLKEDFFDRLRGINNRCPNLEHEDSFETYKMGTLMGQNKGKGCVLIFLRTDNLEKKIEKKDRISEKDGIYNWKSMKLTDAWPEKQNTEDMAEKAVAGWNNRKKTDMYIGQWVVTPNYPFEPHSLMQIAVLPTNPALYWRGVNEMSPTAFPNVLLIDYIGNVILNVNEPDFDEDLSAEMQVLAIGLNLYMISENCEINTKRPPLLPSDSKASRLAGGRGKTKSWNGVIFANGTRFDQPISGAPLGCLETLPKGTVFGNGTVLDRDMPNPGCQPTRVQAPNATLPSFTPGAIRRRMMVSLSG